MNRLYRLLIIFAATEILIALPVLGAPVRGKLVKPFQPDGTRIEVLCWGDEYYVVAESLDGYTLTRDPKTGFICYATISADGTQLVSTGVVVKEKAPAGLGIPLHARIRREAAAAAALAARERALARRGRKPPVAVQPARSLLSPTTGTVQGICLIVDFSDDVGTIPRANVVNYCNQVGYTGYGNNGSIRDYYFDVSNGQLTFTHYVTAAYYRAQHAKTYYADSSVRWGERSGELVKEALESLNGSGFDFSQYDADSNGEVDSVSCFYAGSCTNAWAEGLWPGNIGLGSAWSADGVNVTEFQITDMGASLTIETFCHECGHLLMDWPDLYDYGDDSAGVGAFCIMCNGASAINPIEPCAYLKVRAGWANVIELTSPQGLLIATAGTNTVYKVSHPTLSREFYLFENRQRTGRDSALPDDGLAIWHIDTEGSNNNQQMSPTSHYLVTLVQADGLWDLENNRNRGDTTDLYAAPTYTACTPYTNPAATWWDDSASTIFVDSISVSANSMTFSFDYAPSLWVDFAYAGWPELGSFFNPYNTLAEGVFAVPEGGHLWIKGGSSAETATMTKAMVVYAYGGSVVIGQ